MIVFDNPDRPGIIDQLNGYQGDNLWEDLIKGLPGYDEGATAEIDPSAASDRFVAGEVTYRYDESSQRWFEQS